MLVLDEEAHLGGCLESIQPLVDEIVVMVDDRTTDGSYEIARHYGATVSTFQWQQDFSLARNQTFDRIQTDWVLCIDPDERLQPVARSVFEQALNDPESVGIRLLLCPGVCWTHMWQLRIARNHPRIRFEGIVHNRLTPSVHRLIASDGGIVSDLPVLIEHLGYDNGMDKVKAPARASLYLKSLERSPQDAYMWRALATTCRVLEDFPGAREALDKSLEVIRARSTGNPSDALTYYDLIQALMEEGGDPGELIDEVSRRFPDYPTTLWLKAKWWMEKGEFAESIPLLEQLVELGRTRAFDRAVSHDLRIFDEFPFTCLGTCFFQTGNSEKAAHYFKKALRLDPSNLETRLKAKVAGQMHCCKI